MDKRNLPKHQQPLCVSVCSNDPGFQTPVCFIYDTGDDEDSSSHASIF